MRADPIGIRRLPDLETAGKQTVAGRTMPHSAVPNPAAQLQRALGNRALGEALSRASIGRGALPAGVQAKLTVGPAGDKYEQEAEHVGRVVADKLDSSPAGGQSVQRQAEEEEELQMQRAPEAAVQRDLGEQEEAEEEELQMQRAPEATVQRDLGEQEEAEEEELQMQRSEDGFEVEGALEQQIDQSRGRGMQMDRMVQAQMESAFGNQFSDVQIHTDAKADQMARSIGANAFTTGSDIFFRQGQYNPDSRQGRELLGHELTHVVQQRGGKVSG